MGENIKIRENNDKDIASLLDRPKFKRPLVALGIVVLILLIAAAGALIGARAGYLRDIRPALEQRLERYVGKARSLKRANQKSVHKKSTPEYYGEKAQEKFQAGNYSGAVKEYTRAIQIDPGNMESYFGRANAYLQIYLYQKALEDYTKAIQLSPRKSEYYSGRALVYYGLNDYKAALADYDRAVALAPNNGELYRKRAYVKEKNLNYKPNDLAPDWKKAIALGVEDEHLFVSYGNYLNNQLQDYAGALNYFQKAVKLNPENTLARKNAEIAKGNLENLKSQ